MTVFDGLPDIFVGAFGEPVSYVPKATGVAVALSGIIETPSIDVATAEAGYAPMVSVAPTLSIQTSSLPAQAAVGDTLTVRGTTYSVRVFRPDGRGMTRLQLEDLS